MKRLTILLCCLLLLSSCSLKFYPLKGQYPATPIIGYSDKSFDKVWDNIIDLFSQQGLSIKIIDRSSGLIISTQGKLKASYENKKGELYIPKAYVVVEQNNMESEENRKAPLFEVLGEWNIRIKNENGRTSININIVNITSERPGYGGRVERFDPHAHTTGYFEKMIFDIIK